MVLESKNHGPGLDIIKCFVEEAQADLKSPITSMFGNKIGIYHKSVQDLTEVSALFVHRYPRYADFDKTRDI